MFRIRPLVLAFRRRGLSLFIHCGLYLGVIALPHCAVAVSASILTSNFVKYEIIDLSSYFVLGHFDEEISDVFSFYVLFYLNSLTKERSLFALSFYRNAC